VEVQSRAAGSLTQSAKRTEAAILAAESAVNSADFVQVEDVIAATKVAAFVQAHDARAATKVAAETLSLRASELSSGIT